MVSGLTNKLRDRQAMSGYLFAIGATAIWSGNFIVARGLTDSIQPISLAFWRWVVAVMVFLPFALKPLIVQWEIFRKNIFYLSVTSLLGITLFNTLIYFAGHTTTAVNLSLISITFPIFIVILSRIFFHESITLKMGLGILLVAAGVVFLITKGDIASLSRLSFAIGDLWMLLAAVAFAVYSILLKCKPERLSIWAFQLGTFMLGLLFLFPFFLWETLTSPPAGFDTKTLFSVLYIGIFASLAAFVLWNKAIDTVGPSKAGMIYYTLPLFSGVLAYLFLQEGASINHFYSAVLIVSGIITANKGGNSYGGRKKNQKNPEKQPHP